MPDPSETHTLIVDGGGTGTRVRLLSPAGDVLSEATAGPSNISHGVERAWRHVEEAASRAAGEAQMSSLEGLRLWGGFAGAGVPEREADFIAADPLNCREIVVFTDGVASLAGAFEGSPGAIVAVGTGVIALAHTKGGALRWAGGWGFPLADEGGGAWIGQRALASLAAHIDGRREMSGAFASALRQVVGQNYADISDWHDHAGATEYASLAPLVTELAEGGDPAAGRILSDAAAEVERALKAVSAEGPAALLGGLAHVLTPYLSPETRARLQSPRGTALDGLQRLAMEGRREPFAFEPPLS